MPDSFTILWFSLAVYAVFVQIIAIAITCMDKKKAQKGKWRIRESTLFLVAAFGGALSMYLTMKAIRHKTRHRRFMTGLPVIFVIHLFCIFFATTF